MDDRLSGLKLTSLMLADFANVREGLLNVVSAGLTRVSVPQVPASVHLYLALMVYIPPERAEDTHTGRVLFKYPDSAQTVAQASIQLHANAKRMPGEGLTLPVVVTMQPIALPRFGQIDVQVELDGMPMGDLSFWLVQSAPKQ